MVFSETKNSLTIFTKLSVRLFKIPVPFLSFRDCLSSDIDVSTEFPDSFRGSLCENTKMRISSLVRVDRKGVLVCGVERQSALFSFIVSNNWELLSGLDDIGNRLEEFDETGLRSVTSCRHIHIKLCLELTFPFNLFLSEFLFFLFFTQCFAVINGIYSFRWQGPIKVCHRTYNCTFM